MDQTHDKDASMTVHLEELRKRIIYSLIFFGVAIIVGFVYSDDVVNYLKEGPAAKNLDWHVFGISDALSVYIKISLLLGLILSIPFILYQVWAFVKPELKEHEQRMALRFIPAASLLFLVGIGFGYFILWSPILCWS